ncbi:chemotaxis protein CheX [Aminithiophilus ramosus]|uniref:Chemotaxis protein CheX n=2 Tax=Synergistales TaxID=649776 RepID=A0A9Q7AQ23_9BACT|nr:chemotaxis protein CheX [Aminithiophilus ramosus]QTX32777.1 chemotaxis protein CheX [Aminithiophilus ramosus]QVL36652.1 chemotaxis protein CheX [Synergistota bacterium]
MEAQNISKLVNSFGAALLSVGQSVGLSVRLDKGAIGPGVNAPGSRAAALIGFVGAGLQGTVAIMIDEAGFGAFVTSMSGGLLAPDMDDPVALSVLGELTNMVSGQAIMKLNVQGLDITPPQIITGENIKSVPSTSQGVRNFTLPFHVSGGRVFLVLTVHG